MASPEDNSAPMDSAGCSKVLADILLTAVDHALYNASNGGSVNTAFTFFIIHALAIRKLCRNEVVAGHFEALGTIKVLVDLVGSGRHAVDDADPGGTGRVGRVLEVRTCHGWVCQVIR